MDKIELEKIVRPIVEDVWFNVRGINPVENQVKEIVDALSNLLEKLVMPNEVVAGGTDGCPCLHTSPCHSNCTCANPHLSGGCFRCAKYGNEDQQKNMAKHLAKIIDESQRKA